MRQEKFLSLAKKVSHRSDHHSHKLGAVITRGNRVLGTGHNTMKTHPHSSHFWKSTHAEFMATLSAGYDIKGATVYVYREQKDGTPAMSRPCRYCWDFLMSQGVKKVVYTFEGSFKEEKVS